MSHPLTPSRNKTDKSSIKSFRSSKSVFGLVSPARPAAPTTTNQDIILSESGFQWGASGSRVVSGASTTRSAQLDLEKASAAERSHTRSTSLQLSSSPGSTTSAPPSSPVTEPVPVPAVDVSADVDVTGETPSITSSRTSEPSNSSNHNSSTYNTENTSLDPMDIASTTDEPKNRSRSPSIKSLPASETRSHSPSSSSLSHSNESANAVPELQSRCKSAAEVALPPDAPSDFLPAVEVTSPAPANPSTTTGLPDHSSQPFPTSTANLEPPALGEAPRPATPDPRSPLTYRPRHSFTQRSSTGTDWLSKLRQERNATGLIIPVTQSGRPSSHRRALSDGSVETPISPRNPLSWAAELRLTAAKVQASSIQGSSKDIIGEQDASSSGSSSSSSSSSSSDDGSDDSNDDTLQRRRDEDETPKSPEKHAEFVFEQCPIEASQAETSLNDSPQAASTSFEHSVSSGSETNGSMVIIPTPVIQNLVSEPEPISEAPGPTAHHDLDSIAFQPSSRRPSGVSTKTTSLSDLAQVAVAPIVIGAGLGLAHRVGTGHASEKCDPAPKKCDYTPEKCDPVPVIDAPKVQPKAHEPCIPCVDVCSKSKHPDYLELLELATFRGQLSIALSWLEHQTLPSVNISSDLAHLYETDQEPGFNLSILKSRATKRTAFEKITTRTYTLRFVGCTTSVPWTASCMAMASFIIVTYGFMWGLF